MAGVRVAHRASARPLALYLLRVLQVPSVITHVGVFGSLEAAAVGRGGFSGSLAARWDKCTQQLHKTGIKDGGKRFARFASIFFHTDAAANLEAQQFGRWSWEVMLCQSREG